VPNSSASVNFTPGDSSGRRRGFRARHSSPSSCRRSDVSRTRSSRFAPMATRWAAHVRVVGGEQTTGPPSSIYVRTTTGHEAAVQELLARTAKSRGTKRGERQPAVRRTHRSRRCDRGVRQPRSRAGRGGTDRRCIGVANIMIVSVLERRSEIGLRRALGATKGQIRAQFLGESILLAVIDGVIGVLAGVAATAVYASSKHWAVLIPVQAWSGGIATAVLIGAFAGLVPAVRASRMPPAVALRTA
jgi:putative ABC transport system permease protein